MNKNQEKIKKIPVENLHIPKNKDPEPISPPNPKKHQDSINAK